jgi:hypothetical protein
MSSEEVLIKVLAKLETIEKMVVRSNDELRILRKKTNVMSKRIMHIEQHLLLKPNKLPTKRAKLGQCVFFGLKAARTLLEMEPDCGAFLVEPRVSFWMDKPVPSGFMRFGRGERVPRETMPLYFREFIENHFTYPENHIVYLTSNRLYLYDYKTGQYSLKSPTKRALKGYVQKLVEHYYHALATSKQAEHIRFRIKDIVLEKMTDQVVNYVQNYVIQIKDMLQKSYNAISK